ncbi:Flavonoid 3'5'-hydroxylase, partial [Musa troglodytarum]
LEIALYYILRFVVSRLLPCLSPLPPDPRGFPVVGALPLLGSALHVTLVRMAKRYGPVMHLKMGRFGMVVASTPDDARVFLETLYPYFSNRLAYGGQMLGNKALESWAAVQRNEVDRMSRSIHASGRDVGNKTGDMTTQTSTEARRHPGKTGSSTGPPKFRRHQSTTLRRDTSPTVIFPIKPLRRRGRGGDGEKGDRLALRRKKGKGEGRRRRRKEEESKKRRKREETLLTSKPLTRRGSDQAPVAAWQQPSSELPSLHGSSQALSSHRCMTAAELPSLHSSSQAAIAAWQRPSSHRREEQHRP